MLLGDTDWSFKVVVMQGIGRVVLHGGGGWMFDRLVADAQTPTAVPGVQTINQGFGSGFCPNSDPVPVTFD